MASIKVRRLGEQVIQRLKQRASMNNRSLEGEAHHILRSAVEDDMAVKRAAFFKTMERMRPLTSGRLHTPAEDLIREDRDRGHRDEY